MRGPGNRPHRRPASPAERHPAAARHSPRAPRSLARASADISRRHRPRRSASHTARIAAARPPQPPRRRRRRRPPPAGPRPRPGRRPAGRKRTAAERQDRSPRKPTRELSKRSRAGRREEYGSDACVVDGWLSDRRDRRKRAKNIPQPGPVSIDPRRSVPLSSPNRPQDQPARRTREPFRYPRNGR